MTQNTSLLLSPIHEIAELIESRKLSPVELTSLQLERIKQLNPTLNAFVSCTEELAIQQALEAEKDIMNGNYKSKLHGIPIAHKDIYYTKNVLTTCGSAILKDFVPTYNATSVSKLSEAGSILVGKTQTHEFAAGGTTRSIHYPPCNNPWNIDRSTGGSSGGSGSAVAAGMTFLASGSDTGGSIRIPAAACGIVGLKPTYGRISRYGIHPLAWTLDHAGLLCRSVADAAIGLQHMAGFDALDATSSSTAVPNYFDQLKNNMKNVRIGIPKQFFFDALEDDVKQNFWESVNTFKALGATIQEVSIPTLDHCDSMIATILWSETATIHYQNYLTSKELFGSDVRNSIEIGQSFSAVDYLHANRVREKLKLEFTLAFKDIDVMIAPAISHIPPYNEVEFGSLLARLSSPCNLTGLPSIAIPNGFSKENIPTSLQIIGKPFDEQTILNVGYTYEQHTTWHTYHPETIQIAQV